MGNKGSKEIQQTGSGSVQTTKSLLGHKDSISCMIFEEKGRCIYTGSRDASARKWNPLKKRGDCLLEFLGHTFWIECMKVSTARSLLFTGSADNTIRSWNTKNGKQVTVFKGHTNDVTCLELGDAEDLIFSSSRDGTVKKWKVSTGQMLTEYKGHSNWIESIAWLPQLERLYTGSFDRTSKMWDVDTGACLMTLGKNPGSNVQCICINSQGEDLYTGSFDGSIDKWCLSSGNHLWAHKAHHDVVVKMILRDETDELFTASKDSSCKRWDIPPTTSSRSSEGEGALALELLTMYRSQHGAIKCMELTQTFLLAGSVDNNLRAFFIDTGECVMVFRGHHAPVTCCVVISSANSIVTASDDKRLLVWKHKFSPQDKKSSSQVKQIKQARGSPGNSPRTAQEDRDEVKVENRPVHTIGVVESPSGEQAPIEREDTLEKISKEVISDAPVLTEDDLDFDQLDDLSPSPPSLGIKFPLDRLQTGSPISAPTSPKFQHIQNMNVRRLSEDGVRRRRAASINVASLQGQLSRARDFQAMSERKPELTVLHKDTSGWSF